MFNVAIVHENDLTIGSVGEYDTLEQAVEAGVKLVKELSSKDIYEDFVEANLSEDFVYSGDLGTGKGWAVNIFTVG